MGAENFPGKKKKFDQKLQKDYSIDNETFFSTGVSNVKNELCK